MFSSGFFGRKSGDLIKVRALDFGLWRREHADLYPMLIENSAGFVVLVSVLSYEP